MSFNGCSEIGALTLLERRANVRRTANFKRDQRPIRMEFAVGSNTGSRIVRYKVSPNEYDGLRAPLALAITAYGIRILVRVCIRFGQLES